MIIRQIMGKVTCRLSFWTGGVVAMLSFALVSCAGSDNRVHKKKLPISLTKQLYQSANWSKIDHDASLQAFRQSCRKIDGQHSVLGKDYNPSKLCMRADDTYLNNKSARNFFEENFVLRPGVQAGDDGLITGYYEPVIKAAQRPVDSSWVPVYGAPLSKQSPIYKLTRQQINRQGRSVLPVLAYMPRIERFFLQIQGSGRLKMPNGQIICLGFHSKTKQPYRSIGKLLIDREAIKRQDVSLFSLKQWLYAHPAQVSDVLEHNPSFVFFHEQTDCPVQSAPVGAIGVPLTAGVSLAVDPKYYPYGLPVWLRTTVPQQDGGMRDFRNLMIIQDTGSAIKGIGRADVFWGQGSQGSVIEYRAGHMKQSGRLYLLLPRI